MSSTKRCSSGENLTRSHRCKPAAAAPYAARTGRSSALCSAPGQAASQHLDEDQAQRMNIGARIGFGALQLLGRHVLHGADDHPRVVPLGPAPTSCESSDSEVHAPAGKARRPRRSTTRQEHVLRLGSRCTMPLPCAAAMAARLLPQRRDAGEAGPATPGTPAGARPPGTPLTMKPARRELGRYRRW